MNNNFAQFCLIVIGLQMLFQIQVIMADCDLKLPINLLALMIKLVNLMFNLIQKSRTFESNYSSTNLLLFLSNLID